MKTHFYCKVWQALVYKDMASCAQQTYNRTFGLMHGLNSHSNENYGLGHSFVLCKHSLSEVVSQAALTNVYPGTAMLGLAPQRYGPIDSRVTGCISEGTRAQVPLKMCVSGIRGEKKRDTSCGGSCSSILSHNTAFIEKVF